MNVCDPLMMEKVGGFTALLVLQVIVVVFSGSTDAAVTTTADNQHCAGLSRAVKKFCSYDVAKKYCPVMCKDGKSPNLSCGKNLHTSKQKGLKISQKATKRSLGRALNRIKGEQDIAKSGSKRVVKGEKSEQGEWPWHLTIRNFPKKEKTKVGARWCDATILTENFALAAAHCFQKELKKEVGHSNFTAEYMKVIAGDYDTETKEEFEDEIQIAEIKTHPKFSGKQYDSTVDPKYDNGAMVVMVHDFTLLKLATPIKLQDGNKEQVCIPKSDSYDIWKDAQCFTYGYGFKEDGKHANI